MKTVKVKLEKEIADLTSEAQTRCIQDESQGRSVRFARGGGIFTNFIYFAFKSHTIHIKNLNKGYQSQGWGPSSKSPRWATCPCPSPRYASDEYSVIRSEKFFFGDVVLDSISIEFRVKTVFKPNI